MDDNLLTNEQWFELWEAINLFEEKGDRTVLNEVLVLIMRNVVESLDDDSVANECNDVEKQFVITVIEIEIAQMIAVNTCPSWCCHRRRIQPFNQNSYKFADYLINIARAKVFDKNNSGFITKEIIQRIFKAQLSNEIMAELLQFVETNNDGDISYKDFATLMLITDNHVEFCR